MAEPDTDTNLSDGCDGECEVPVDVPAGSEHFDGGGAVPAETSESEDTGLAQDTSDPESLRVWVNSIKPADFSAPETEAFFVRWDALGLPELNTDTLYQFSGTPEETHAAALAALDRWQLPEQPEPQDETPTLRAFTDLVL
jgi:hypothetical protein